MNTILPEGRTQIVGGTKTIKVSAEQQIAELHEILAGNGAFGACRGNFHRFPYEKILNENNVPVAPSSAQKKLYDWIGTQRVMVHLLAKLKRDGYGVAFRELEKALCDYEYVLTGETIPVEETEPGVLVLFDPVKTLLIIRWMYTSRIEDAKSFIKDGKIPDDRGLCGSLTRELLGLFPELEETFRDSNGYSCESPTKVLYQRIHDAGNLFERKFPRDDVRYIFPDTHRCSGDWKNGNAIGIFLLNKTQAEVLSIFSRDEQGSIGSWRFDYPKITSGSLRRSWNFSRYQIGLHPEQEHNIWSRQWPSYISKGCAFGHGAVIVDHEQVGDSDQINDCVPNPNKLLKYKPLLTPHPNYLRGDLKTKRMVIGF